MMFRQSGSAGTVFIVWLLAAGLGFFLVAGNNSALSGLGQIILLVTVVFPLLLVAVFVLFGASKHWAEMARRHRVVAENARLDLVRQQHQQAVAAEAAAQTARQPQRMALKKAILQSALAELDRQM